MCACMCLNPAGQSVLYVCGLSCNMFFFKMEKVQCSLCAVRKSIISLLVYRFYFIKFTLRAWEFCHPYNLVFNPQCFLMLMFQCFIIRWQVSTQYMNDTIHFIIKKNTYRYLFTGIMNRSVSIFLHHVRVWMDKITHMCLIKVRNINWQTKLMKCFLVTISFMLNTPSMHNFVTTCVVNTVLPLR